MKLFRIIVVATVFVIVLSQTAFTLKYAHGKNKCYYEKIAVETIDSRGFLTKLINPSTGGTVYENQYNCYYNPKTITMKVWSGYIVTYQRFGRHYQRFMQKRPRGKYITIMSNQG
jgi:hypothetical protein